MSMVRTESDATVLPAAAAAFESAPAALPGLGETIAVVIPCLDEFVTVGKVIEDFRAVLPDAGIYVIDNGSTDGTASIARALGVHVIAERRRGKGEAVRTAFRRIDADYYILVDGDDTYVAAEVGRLLAPVVNGDADMVVGSRTMKGSNSDFRPVNRLGNRLFPWILTLLLQVRLTDILSGFRVMNRELVKGVPIVARGFEIEVELTMKSVERGFRLREVPIGLRARPEGSTSKLRIIRDGSRILWTIMLLFRDYRPMALFGMLGLLLMLLATIPGIIVIKEFAETGKVPRLPSAVLSVGMMLSGMLSIAVGLVLSAVSRRFQELEYKVEMQLSRFTPSNSRDERAPERDDRRR